MNLLYIEGEQIKLNSIQLISSVAEHPDGRIKAKACLEKLKEIKLEYEFLIPYIDDAIEIITWIP